MSYPVVEELPITVFLFERENTMRFFKMRFFENREERERERERERREKERAGAKGGGQRAGLRARVRVPGGGCGGGRLRVARIGLD